MRPRISILGRVRRMVGRSVGWIVGWSVTRFFQTLKMSRFLYENHWGSPTLTLLNVLGVLGVVNVLNVLNVLHVFHVLHVLNMPMDASLACWALFFFLFHLTQLLMSSLLA